MPDIALRRELLRRHADAAAGIFRCRLPPFCFAFQLSLMTACYACRLCGQRLRDIYYRCYDGVERYRFADIGNTPIFHFAAAFALPHVPG